MMTETEELTIRRDTLKGELEKARQDVLAREGERQLALHDLESQRDELLTSVKDLQQEVDDLEASMLELNEEWKKATTEAASAKEHLEELRRGS